MNSVARSHVEHVFSAVGTRDSPLRSMSNFPGESWHRCLHDYKLTPEHPPEIPVLSYSESRLAREAMGEALVLAVEEMDALYKLVSAVGYTVMITDHRCMTVAEPMDAANSRETRLLGSIWTERETGTNGVGTCLHDVRPTSVYLREHFFGQHVDFSCACFPLVDYRNQAWGALDLAIRNPHLGPDVHRFVMQVGREAAERIDEAVFRATFRHCMIAKLRNKEGRHGLLAIREGQRIIAASQAMREMLGLKTSDFGAVGLETLFVGGADLFRRAMNTGRIQIHGVRGEIFLGSVTPSAEMRAMPNSVSSTRILAPNRVTRSVAGDTISLDDWAGAEMSMMRSVEVIRKTLPFDLPILILGETGTGKDTLARAIHRESQRRDKPFVALNCGAIPEDLIEAELFGYVDGAFTGARRDGSRGHLLRADGGTLFLDEIGEMPVGMQVRLLRVLESGEVTPLGGSAADRINVQVIAATNSDLEDKVSKGEFRLDLFHRLYGVLIEIPSLRQRSDRRAVIASMFQKVLETGQILTPEALDLLDAWEWRGNIRELKLVATRAVALAQEKYITPDSLLLRSLSLRPAQPGRSVGAGPESPLGSVSALVAATERQAVAEALDHAGGNARRAAQEAGMSRATFYRRLKRHGIPPK